MEKYTLKRHKITQISLVILLIFSLTLCFPLSVLAEDVVPDDIEDQMNGYEWTDDAKEDVWAIFGATTWSAVTTICENDGNMSYFIEDDTLQAYGSFEDCYGNDIKRCLAGDDTYSGIAKSSVYEPESYYGIVIYIIYKMFYFCDYENFSCEGSDGNYYSLAPISLSEESYEFNLYNNSTNTTVESMTFADGTTVYNPASFVLHVFFNDSVISDDSRAMIRLTKDVYQKFGSFETYEFKLEEDANEHLIAFADIYENSFELAVAITSVFLPDFYNWVYEESDCYSSKSELENNSTNWGEMFNQFLASSSLSNSPISSYSENMGWFEVIATDVFNSHVAIKSDGHIISAY